MKPVKTSHGLPRSRRLPGPAEFKSVFDSSQQRASHRHLLILAHHHHQPQGRAARLGLVISKKNVRLSTQRNRIRRLVREHFRQEVACTHQDTDYIVLARPGLDRLSNKEIFMLLKSRFEQLSRKATAPT